jgi:hypothetical protein
LVDGYDKYFLTQRKGKQLSEIGKIDNPSGEKLITD